jgi:hypothetical protein
MIICIPQNEKIINIMHSKNSLKIYGKIANTLLKICALVNMYINSYPKYGLILKQMITLTQ